MRKILFAILALSALAYSQTTWSGIVASSRAIDWSTAGLPPTFLDGETAVNPWTPPTPARASCGTISTVVGLTAALNTCHTNHPNGGVLTLSAGTYTLTSTNLTFLPAANNVTLAGQGASNTKIIFAGSSQIQFGLGSSTAGGGIGAKFASSPAAGTNSFNINSVTGSPMFQVGDIVTIIECNTGQSGTPNPSGGGCAGTQTDNGSIFFCGNILGCNIDGAGTNASVGQTVRITALTNLGGGTFTVGITPGIYLPNLSTTQSVGLFWNDRTFSPTAVGIEDMTVETTATNSSGGVVSITSCYACWIKGVRFVGKGVSGSTILNMGASAGGGPKNFLFANNYTFAENPQAISNDLTLAWSQSTDGDNLFLNNILEFGFFEGQGANSGDVIAYNTILNSQGSGATFYESAEFQHHPGSTFTLMEGNHIPIIREDDTWGTHNLNTFFRNYTSCYDPPFIGGNSGQAGLQFDSYSRFENAVANAIGDGNSSGCTVFSSASPGAAFEINFGPGDSLTATTLFRWANVTTFLQGSDTPASSGKRCVASEVPSALSAPNVALSNPVPTTPVACGGAATIPASFFMSTTAHPSGGTGLSWWKTCTTWTSFPATCGAYTTQPFPAIGPDVSGGTHLSGFVYDIPAVLAWKALPVDTAYQTSYTVTGSSWAAGVETLTVTGLPSGSPHIMGGFTPPAWNSACNPVSGVSYTGGYRTDGEILITDSNATTAIKYALSGNPGVTCSGTIKWPDVRKFDEVAYQLDSGGGAGGTATVLFGGKATGAVIK